MYKISYVETYNPNHRYFTLGQQYSYSYSHYSLRFLVFPKDLEKRHAQLYFGGQPPPNLGGLIPGILTFLLGGASQPEIVQQDVKTDGVIPQGEVVETDGVLAPEENGEIVA